MPTQGFDRLVNTGHALFTSVSQFHVNDLLGRLDDLQRKGREGASAAEYLARMRHHVSVATLPEPMPRTRSQR